ncbi:lipopolysaccharide biosynthesis protein [Kaistella yonginensis]|uniref:lipopolysaccharide biosynthesis protein n=1 Tax=Kaistella yonginensis TaxID=658267 RepID=UPI0025B456E7|nr:MATE family efflux transporter [Kaistella yonginensis]MDN3607575.1 MATE family efflux transporter [Kaistella yonginensis]
MGKIIDKFSIIKKFKKYLVRDNELSQTILKNVLMSFGVRVGSIVVGLLLVPITLGYVSPAEYGIWLTVSSIVSWLSFFDIGLANGLRNRLSESNANKNVNESRKYVSTTYAAIGAISIFILLLFFISNHFFDWQLILNVYNINNKTLQLLFLVVVTSFCIQLTIGVINSILLALHKAALSGFMIFLGQAGVLVGVYLLKLFCQPNLLYLFIVLTSIPIIIITIASIILFRTDLQYVKPSVKYVSRKHLKSIFNLGGAFFIVQLGALVLFQTDNFVISKVLGPEAVAEFNIAYKLFSLTTMVSFIILTPYWSAYSDAWARKDFIWMRKNLQIIRKIWLILSFCNIALYLLAPFLYKIWIGDTIIISSKVSFAMMIYSIVITFQASHNYIINGLGKIKLQMYLMIFAAILNIPFSFYLGGIYGIPGVIYANVFFMGILGITFYFQLNYLFKTNNA